MGVVYRHKWIICGHYIGSISSNIQIVYGTIYNMVYMVVCRTIYIFFNTILCMETLLTIVRFHVFLLF